MTALIAALAVAWCSIGVARGAPPPPQTVTAVAASPSQINVSWTRVTGATAYRILRSTVVTGPFSQIGMSSGTNFSSTGLAAGKTYHYVVQSYGGGFSANSSVASAMTPSGTTSPTPPSPPTGLTAVSGGTRVTLTWTASTGAPVYRYEIHRSTDGTAYAAMDAVGGSVTTYTDANPPGNGVWYRIVAVGAYGSSGGSNVVFVPGTPVLSSAAPANDSQSFLVWTLPSGATGYELLRSATSGGPFTLIATLGANPTFAHVDGNLSASTTYHYVVRALGSGGTGTSFNSNELTVTTTAVQPPTNVSATAIDNVRVDLTWTPPGSLTPDANGFVVYHGTTDPPSTPLVVNGGTTSGVSVTGLAANTLYYFQVQTTTPSNGPSVLAPPSAISATTLPVQPPTGVTGTAASSTRIDLTWTLSTSPDTNGYVITYGTTDPPSGNTVTTAASPTFPIQIAGLNPSTTYYFQVHATTPTNGPSVKAPAPALARTTLPPRRLLIYAGDSTFANVQHLQNDMAALGGFAVVDALDARAVDPSLAQLQAYDVVLTFTAYGPYANSTNLGNTLANYHDAGGKVVVCEFGQSWGIGGRWQSQNYFLTTGFVDPSGFHSMSIVNPTSPVLFGVTSFSETNGAECVNVANGGVAVARWSPSNRPFIVTGSIHGQNRVELGFYPCSRDNSFYSSVWNTPASILTILKNACNYGP